MAQPKFCSNCGASLGEGVRFCAQCGKKLDEGAPSATAAPATTRAGETLNRVGSVIGTFVGTGIQAVRDVLTYGGKSKCGPCRGSGVCNTCNGAGSQGNITCVMCIGTGKCRNCNGLGWA